MEKQFRKHFRIKGRAVRQTGEDEREDSRAYYSGIISTQELDSYYSRMGKTTLENFATGAEEGVTVLDSHRHNTAGIGMSVSGSYEDGKVYSDFYLVTDVPLDGQSYSNTDGFVKMLDDGALRDISVGFYGGIEYCDICSQNIWGRDCCHWPGYDFVIGDGEDKQIVTCTTTIEGAKLSEYSLVFDGSTPGAEVVEKANYLAEKGLIDTKQKHFIENRFNVRFNQGLKFPKPNTDEVDKIDKTNNQEPQRVEVTGGDSNMTIEELQTQVEEKDEQIEQLRENVDTYKEKSASAIAFESENETLKTKNTQLEKRQSDDADTINRLLEEKKVIQAKVDEIEPMAEEGERYRKIEEQKAYEEFVRFRGEDLNEEAGDSERAKNTLANLPTIKDVRDMAENWTEIANAKYEAGRTTVDNDDDKDDDKTGDDDKTTDEKILPTPDSY